MQNTKLINTNTKIIKEKTKNTHRKKKNEATGQQIKRDETERIYSDNIDSKKKNRKSFRVMFLSTNRSNKINIKIKNQYYTVLMNRLFYYVTKILSRIQDGG